MTYTLPVAPWTGRATTVPTQPCTCAGTATRASPWPTTVWLSRYRGAQLGLSLCPSRLPQPLLILHSVLHLAFLLSVGEHGPLKARCVSAHLHACLCVFRPSVCGSVWHCWHILVLVLQAVRQMCSVCCWQLYPGRALGGR